MAISYQPIGLIHSPFQDIAGMPIQPSGAANIQGSVELFSEFGAGLKDLAGFSHIILLYHFHQVQESKLLVKPFMDSQARGIFATRAESDGATCGFMAGLDLHGLLGQAVGALHPARDDVFGGFVAIKQRF